MFEQDTWREALSVYLAAGKRLYTAQLEEEDKHVSEWIYKFVPSQVIPIEVDPNLLAYVLSLGTDIPSQTIHRALEGLMDQETDTVERGVLLGWTREWRGEVVKKILIRETSHGIQLQLIHDEWRTEVTYRGDYSIEWMTHLWGEGEKAK